MINNSILVNTKDKTKFYLVDLEKRICYIVGRNQKSTEEFDSDECKYIGDDIRLDQSFGTLAYINKELGFYGILRERRESVGILWIKIEDAEADERFCDIANKHNSLYDITDLGLDVLSQSWNNKLKKSCIVRNIKGTLLNRDAFLQGIGIKSDTNITSDIDNECDKINDNINISELDTKSEKVTGNKLIEENEENSDCTSKNLENIFNNYMKSIEKRMLEVAKREEAVALKEKELVEKSNRLNKLIAMSDGIELDNALETLVEVNTLIYNGNIQDELIDKPDYLYEVILKILNVNDCISVPTEYYKKLKITLHKNLEYNTAYTRYKALVTLKFNALLQENITAIIDFDEQKPTVGLTILKPYNKIQIDDNLLKNYLVEYAKWRKQSFIKG